MHIDGQTEKQKDKDRGRERERVDTTERELEGTDGNPIKQIDKQMNSQRNQNNRNSLGK